MRIVLNSLILVGFLLVSACSEDDSTLKAPESAIDNALAIIPGTVLESEPEMEDGIAAWKVEIRAANGAELEVYSRQDNGELLRIDGESGPFDYNIDPGSNLIDFNQAQAIGTGAAIGDLMAWRLRAEDKFNNLWVYTLEYDQSTVSVNAVDGSVLEVES